MRNDGYWAGKPSQAAFKQVAVPTLIASCEDDLFGTAATARHLAFFAPSRFADPRLSWMEIDASRARVFFTLGPNTVAADLIFNAAGELVDFVSENRGMLEKDGTLRVLRWTTPLGNYREFGGWRLASEGDAIWHLPEGPFAYGHLRLTGYEARQTTETCRCTAPVHARCHFGGFPPGPIPIDLGQCPFVPCD